jgi:DNA-binding MarR family transcriptional regulator
MDSLRRVVRALSASAHGVSGRGGVSGAQLAERTLARQSTVSEVVTRLVERGLVARVVSEADARRAELTLTARGRRAIAGTQTTAQERLADGLTALPHERRIALADTLDAWLVAAGLDDLAATMFFESRSIARAGPSRSRRAKQPTVNA